MIPTERSGTIGSPLFFVGGAGSAGGAGATSLVVGRTCASFFVVAAVGACLSTATTGFGVAVLLFSLVKNAGPSSWVDMGCLVLSLYCDL